MPREGERRRMPPTSDPRFRSRVSLEQSLQRDEELNRLDTRMSIQLPRMMPPQKYVAPKASPSSVLTEPEQGSHLWRGQSHRLPSQNLSSSHRHSTTRASQRGHRRHGQGRKCTTARGSRSATIDLGSPPKDPRSIVGTVGGPLPSLVMRLIATMDQVAGSDNKGAGGSGNKGAGGSIPMARARWSHPSCPL
jgi:hypothetical protein